MATGGSGSLAPLTSRSAADGGMNMQLSDAQMAPRPYASNENNFPAQALTTQSSAGGPDTSMQGRPKKAVRFQVYNAKDMETLRSMRQTMENKFQKMKERSNSPATTRAELIELTKQ